jgi:hypothetical protein
MSAKPSFLWHADESGRCHDACEAWDEDLRGVDGHCRIVGMLPWARMLTSVSYGCPCPFAVLAEALCVHREPTSQTFKAKPVRTKRGVR